MINLPMCFSQLITLTEFDQRGGSWGRKHRNQNFPPGCGDHASNETKIFMDRIGLGYNQTHLLNGDIKELMDSIIPHVSSHYPSKFCIHADDVQKANDLDPYARYMAFCEVGI